MGSGAGRGPGGVEPRTSLGMPPAPAPLCPPRGLAEALPKLAVLPRASAKATLICWFMRSCQGSLGEKDRQEG